jgi:hypothetical protein
MKKIALAVMGLCIAAAAQAGAPDWNKVAERKMKLFYPGQAALEWVMNKPDHSAVPDIVEKKRPCAKCHEGDANDVGSAIVAGKPVGQSKTVLEPKPPAGKAGWMPITFKAAHDGEKVYFRLEWESPAAGGEVMDKKNDVKATIMFDGGVGSVEGAEINGCWATCHDDLRTMKKQASDTKTKYIKGGDVASGKFYDYIQFRSGKGEKPVDGYIASERVRDGGASLVKAEGKKEGNKWVVTFERKLAAAGKGDHTLSPDKIYDFGIAIHENGANFRYHYVSLGYQFGLDKAVEGVKNYYNISKQ